MLGNSSPYNLGTSLFERSHGRSQNFTFVPNFSLNLLEIPFSWNSSNMQTINACGDNLECRFDFAMTLNEDIAKSTMRFSEVLEHIHNIFAEYEFFFILSEYICSIILNVVF